MSADEADYAGDEDEEAVGAAGMRATRRMN